MISLAISGRSVSDSLTSSGPGYLESLTPQVYFRPGGGTPVVMRRLLAAVHEDLE